MMRFFALIVFLSPMFVLGADKPTTQPELDESLKKFKQLADEVRKDEAEIIKKSARLDAEIKAIVDKEGLTKKHSSDDLRRLLSADVMLQSNVHLRAVAERHLTKRTGEDDLKIDEESVVFEAVSTKLMLNMEEQQEFLGWYYLRELERLNLQLKDAGLLPK